MANIHGIGEFRSELFQEPKRLLKNLLLALPPLLDELDRILRETKPRVKDVFY